MDMRGRILSLFLCAAILAPQFGYATDRNILPATEEAPVCWWCALVVPALGVLVPDKIQFGAGGLTCPPGDGLCSIEWYPTSGGGTQEADENLGKYAFGVNSGGDIGLFIPDLGACKTVQGDKWNQSAEFEIPNEIAAALKTSSYSIKKGTYEVMINGSQGFVFFKRN